MRSRFGLGLLALAPIFVVIPAAADWPMARHDTDRTGLASGTSNIVNPAPYWRYFLGGTLTSDGVFPADVDKDGTNEVLYVARGRVSAKQVNDSLIWTSENDGINAIVTVDDFDGDGNNEVLVTGSSQAFLLDARTGSLKWAEPLSDLGTLAGIRVADLDGDKKPDVLSQECWCCGASNGNTGFAYSFGAGFSAAKQLYALPITACGSPRATAVVDLDGDGKQEIAVTDAKTMVVLDAATGAIKATSADLSNAFSYSYCLPVAAGGAKHRILCATSFSGLVPSGHRVTLLDYDPAGPSITAKWQRDVGDLDATLILNSDFVGDLDGDGSQEVVVGAAKAGGAIFTSILDLETGTPLATIDLEPVGVGPKGLILTTSGGDLKGWAFARTPSPAATLRWTLANRYVAPGIDRPLSLVSAVSSNIVSSDVDGDGMAELLVFESLEHINVHAYSQLTATPKALLTFPLPGGTGASLVALAPKPGTDALFVARNDGFLEVLDKTFTPLNAKSPVKFGGYYAAGGWRDLETTPVVAALGGKGESVLVPDSRGRLLRLDAAAATNISPPNVVFAKEHTEAPVVIPNYDGGKPAIAARGLALPLTQPATHQVGVMKANGDVIWQKSLEGLAFGDVLPQAVGGTGLPNLIVQWGNTSDLLLATRAFDSTGAVAWNATAIDPGAGRQPSGYAVDDWDGDGAADVIFQAGGTRVLSGKTGAQIAYGGPPDSYFLPTLYDVDGDGTLEVTLHGGYSAARTLKKDLTTVVWSGLDADRPFPYAAVANCTSAPVLVGGSWADRARLKLTTMSGADAGKAKSIVLASGALYADAAAAIAAKAVMGQLTSASVHKNLQGKGTPLAIVGSSDGWLYGVDPCAGTLAFTYNFSAPVGSAVFGDTDADGNDDIVVSVADGYVYGLRNLALPAPTEVWDIKPGDDAATADIDTTTSTTSLAGKWKAVTGADRYEIAVAGPDGVYLTTPAWTDVGTKTSASVGALTLVSGQRYTFSVRAVSTSKGISPDVPSDGVTVTVVSPDAGPGDTGSEVGDSGVDGGVDSGADASDAAESGVTPPDQGSDGCGCRAVPSSRQSTAPLLGLVVVALLARRRSARSVTRRA